MERTPVAAHRDAASQREEAKEDGFPQSIVSGPGTDVEPPTVLDRIVHAGMARLTAGISPVSLALTYTDWAMHLLQSPGKWEQLAEKAIRKAVRLSLYAARAGAGPHAGLCIEPLAQDRRFRGEAWQRWPFNLYQQGFLLTQQWWHNATTGIGGVSAHHEQVVSFVTRQLLDMVSPMNFIATNPEALDATLQESGMNLLRGAQNFIEDWERAVAGRPPAGAENFQPGKEVARTAGSVVYRNRLIELIQYAPATENVFAEPILIVPAWIMKYYILDLSEHNSLVRHLVSRGHTVFMISWHNPGATDADLDMDDYLKQGVLAALDAVHAIVPGRKIDTVGYCLGGTLLAVVAARLAQRRDDRIHSMTLLAAQADFSEAGELALFIDASQLNYLEDMMWAQGFLTTRQMAGAFQLLRSQDLIWSLIMRDYLLGRRVPMTDLMAWNADTTRMPYRMHTEYLHRFFLDNDFARGRYRVDNRPVALSDVHVPMFAVATETDHVAPWKSVYKIHLLADTDVTFLLTSGGHNAGIVSEPGHRNRRFRISRKEADAHYIDPDTWFHATGTQEGSWWPIWCEWLEGRNGPRVEPPAMGAPHQDYPVLCAAPGTYVFEC